MGVMRRATTITTISRIILMHKKISVNATNRLTSVGAMSIRVQ